MSKIPEGATHTLSGATIEYKKLQPGSQSKWMTYIDGEWCNTFNANPEMYAPIQTEPEWMGGGMPPVGVEIEVKHKDATPEWARPDFYKTEIVAIGKQLVIFAAEATGCETVGKIEDYEFRPVRTPEQIAAEKVSNQLDSDLVMYGVSFSLTNDDGSISRIDPTKIFMRKQVTK